ncbi:MAG: Fe-S cluster assembly protein SufD [Bacteroidales bacterium]|nr:Fe-S cluster assembly protein SufD [Bacteroidales bacterium]
MKAQETYSNLFKNYREVLRLNAARALDGARDTAFARFEALGLPTGKNEDYRYCDLRPALEVDYGLNLFRMGIPAHPGEVFRCDVPTLSTRLFFVVNDLYYPNKKPIELPEGVVFGSLNEQLKAHPELLERYYNALCSQSQDAMAALNTAMVQDGFVLYIPAGVQVEQPLQLVQMFQGDIDIMATRRLLVVLEEGASAQLIVCDHAMSTAKYFSNQVSEIFLGKGARLEYYEMEMTHDKVTRVSNTYVSQAADSDLLMNNIGLENGLTRNNVELIFQEAGSKADLSGLSLLSRQQQSDNHVVVNHKAGGCNSNQTFKYVMDGAARGVFGGKVLVQPGAQQTVALQSNANLCTSKEARMHAMPQLEIYADDVTCSHGSATGQIDENALFYMRQRGLSEEEARMFLKFAFAGDIVERISLKPLQARVRMLIGKRFRGELSKCAECNICP